MDNTFILIIALIVFELFSFITMKFYWPNKIFGILYQIVRVVLCLVVFESLDNKDMGIFFAVLFGFLEFLIISNLIGQAGCKDDRRVVEDVSSVDFAGDTIITISRHLIGDSAWGNMISSLCWSALLAGIIGIGYFFLFQYKPLIGGIIILLISIIRIIGIIQGIIKRFS